MIEPEKSVEYAIVSAVAERRSIRRFLPAPVTDGVVRDILRAASRAPSGMNMQPWQVYIVVDESRARLSSAVRAAAESGEVSLEYEYVPKVIVEPYVSRRRKIGFDLYDAYGIARHDLPARKTAMLRNFDFFGAPVGLFVTVSKDMSLGSWLDCGMFMQNIMIVARAYGLETCPQQAWCDYGAVVHRELAIPDDQMLLSGMALGYADWSAPENVFGSTRVDQDEFARWHR